MVTYHEHRIRNILSIAKIYTIHYFEFSRGFVSETESHPFWEIVYADKGDILCHREGHEYILRQGEMTFHAPNESHGLRSNGKNAPNVFIASFQANARAMDYFRDKVLTLSRSASALIYQIVAEARATFDIPFSDPSLKKMRLLEHPILGGEQLIKNYLEILLISLLRSDTKAPENDFSSLPSEVADQKFVKKVNDYLAENLYVCLSLEQIADALGYGKSYLCTHYKKLSGHGVIDHYRFLKIEKAKEMLRSSALSIIDIANKLSFSSPDYFGQVFLRYVKIMPTAYRKRALALNKRPGQA